MEELSTILDAAEELFKRYGTRSVTMNDVAKSLGISKKTLYQQIENKDDLVLKIAHRHTQRETGYICKKIELAENALAEMLQIVLHVQQTIETINPALLFDLQRFHRTAWKHFEAHQKDFIVTTIKANLLRGMAEGLYRANLRVDFISKIYIASIPIFNDHDFFPLDDFPRAELHFEWINYHVHGIVSPQGLVIWEDYLQNIKR